MHIYKLKTSGWKWTDEQKEYLREVMKQKKLEKIKGASV
jgi:hypothetical protein